MPWSSFSERWVLSQLFHFPLSLSSERLFSFSLLSGIRVVSSAFLRLLIFLLAILIPACASSSPAFLMMYSAAGSQREELHPWQMSWGRWLGITQRQDRASGDPLFPSIYPPNQSAYFTVLCSHLHLWLYGGLSPITISLREGVNLQLQLIKIPGHDKSVSTYKLLWKFSSLPERACLATCDCLQPPKCERHEML